ncbi:protein STRICTOSIDINE SYNTHASE-LIKE 10-like [Magnolia sinica]|uniref:protein STRICTOSIDINE SYNTHASE-LIKE 10-like n=1 Tax=Magnolia sinica TaxID=86752 RepID=UPI0026588692|nr:protein STRICTOSIDINE SYNTHASE-LIKE 10-like [Magnolia sinica]
MKLKLVFVTIAIAFISIFLVLHPFHYLFSTPILAGASNKLQSSEVISVVGAVGPESLAFDPNGGGPYTGISDGRILKWQGKDVGWTEFAVTSPHYLAKRKECEGSQNPGLEHVCGRPLGLRFDGKTGNLYIADAYYGLLMVGPSGGSAVQLATHANGIPFRFTNDLEIDNESGAVYFTDSSARFHRRHFLSTVISGDKTGRLMKYSLETKQVTVLLHGLSFPNGITLSKDGSFLLISETTACRILRFWLRTSKAGTIQVFSQLPGFPDNIRRSPSGDFWVALHSKRGKILEWILSIPLVGDALVRLLPINIEQFYSYLVRWRGSDAMALRLSEEGEVLEVLEDRGGKVLRFVSEVEEINGSLWIGSVVMPFVGFFKL